MVQGSTVTVPITRTEQGGATSADYFGVPGQRDHRRRADQRAIHRPPPGRTRSTTTAKALLLGFGRLAPGQSRPAARRKTTVSLVADSGGEEPGTCSSRRPTTPSPRAAR